MVDKQKIQREEEEIYERTAPTGKVVYRAIMDEGVAELARPSAALFWSGLAAGLSMGFSTITEALLATYIGDAPWRPLVAKLGYSVGFLIVILGRQQLFTENTLTPVLPVLREKSGRQLANMLRLWGVVLVANLIGAVLISLAMAKASIFEPAVYQPLAQIGQKAMDHDALTIGTRAIFAGWLIALMVWLLPFAEVARVWVIIIITYIVGLGQFPHIIAGASEVFTYAAMGQVGWGEVVVRFIVPTLIGNIIGGVTLVAALNHAQVTAGKSEEEME